MLSRTAEPGADVPAVEGKKGKKVDRADARDSRNVPAELMSKFRPEPEVELLDDDIHRVHKSLGTGSVVAQRAPADLISRMADPTADMAGVEGKKGKKAARAGAAGATAEPVELVSKFRKDPEAEMVADDAHGAREARGTTSAEAQRAPADLISHMADPTADVAGLEGKKGKKAARAEAAGAVAEPVEVVSKFRKDPETQMLADAPKAATQPADPKAAELLSGLRRDASEAMMLDDDAVMLTKIRREPHADLPAGIPEDGEGAVVRAPEVLMMSTIRTDLGAVLPSMSSNTAALKGKAQANASAGKAEFISKFRADPQADTLESEAELLSKFRDDVPAEALAEGGKRSSKAETVGQAQAQGERAEALSNFRADPDAEALALHKAASAASTGSASTTLSPTDLLSKLAREPGADLPSEVKRSGKAKGADQAQVQGEHAETLSKFRADPNAEALEAHKAVAAASKGSATATHSPVDLLSKLAAEPTTDVASSPEGKKSSKAKTMAQAELTAHQAEFISRFRADPAAELTGPEAELLSKFADEPEVQLAIEARKAARAGQADTAQAMLEPTEMVSKASREPTTDLPIVGGKKSASATRKGGAQAAGEHSELVSSLRQDPEAEPLGATPPAELLSKFRGEPAADLPASEFRSTGKATRADEAAAERATADLVSRLRQEPPEPEVATEGAKKSAKAKSASKAELAAHQAEFLSKFRAEPEAEMIGNKPEAEMLSELRSDADAELFAPEHKARAQVASADASSAERAPATMVSQFRQEPSDAAPPVAAGGPSSSRRVTAKAQRGATEEAAPVEVISRFRKDPEAPADAEPAQVLSKFREDPEAPADPQTGAHKVAKAVPQATAKSSAVTVQMMSMFRQDPLAEALALDDDEDTEPVVAPRGRRQSTVMMDIADPLKSDDTMLMDTVMAPRKEGLASLPAEALADLDSTEGTMLMDTVERAREPVAAAEPAKPQLLTKSKAQFISALRPDVDTADTLSLAPTVFAPALEEPELDEDEEVKEAEEEAKEADPVVTSRRVAAKARNESAAQAHPVEVLSKFRQDPESAAEALEGPSDEVPEEAEVPTEEAVESPAEQAEVLEVAATEPEVAPLAAPVQDEVMLISALRPETDEAHILSLESAIAPEVAQAADVVPVLPTAAAVGAIPKLPKSSAQFISAFRPDAAAADAAEMLSLGKTVFAPVAGSKPKAPAALQTKVNPAFMSVVRPDWALEEDVMLLDPQDQAEATSSAPAKPSAPEADQKNKTEGKK